ncbi:hypothetical protein AAFF_G00379090 [Aldrovandia affinis]|uniref:Uncharacterized protein n=1 Tax=Aldrovandia affinis TaxID=143900 RepID=A0AAD7WLS8_9TELE|nr:hypothetical protein AAFF_G00379090 [Aldrovandia affinis]
MNMALSPACRVTATARRLALTSSSDRSVTAAARELPVLSGEGQMGQRRGVRGKGHLITAQWPTRTRARVNAQRSIPCFPVLEEVKQAVQHHVMVGAGPLRA